MRILIVVPWDQKVGGVASVVGNLAREFVGRDHGVVFLHPGTEEEPIPGSTKWGFPGYRVRLRGLCVADHPVRSPLAFWVMLIPSLARLVRLLRRERIDVVNLHYPLEDFLPLVLAARLAGRPVVTSVHGADLFPQGEPWARYSMGLRAILALSRRVVTPSKAYLEDVVGQLPSVKGRGVFIHNGIRLTEFSTVSTGQSVPTGSYVLTIANHIRKKGLDVLLPAFASLVERFPETSLVMVGDGPDRAMLEEMASSLGLGERVSFLGALTRAETIALLHHCEVFVLPSLAETFGLAVVEAMACGRAVVASRVGGMKETVRNEVNGLLVEPGDPGALADAMARLLADPDARRRLGQEAIVAAQSFGTKANARTYESLFREVIEKRSR